MKTPHTPGPWEVEIRTSDYCYDSVIIRASKYRRIDSHLNKYICGLPDQTGESEPPRFSKRKSYYDDPMDAAQNMANAQLISAAPELLDALKLLAVWNGNTPCFCHVHGDHERASYSKHDSYCDKARAAIGKAEGRML